MRRALLGVVLLGLVSCGGGFDYGQFRETYVREATLGDEFAERPPELSDGQIDEAVSRVARGRIRGGGNLCVFLPSRQRRR